MKARAAVLIFLMAVLPVAKASAGNEIVTVPVVLGDYYAWAYVQAFEDRADVYGWSLVGTDVLGWAFILGGDPAGLFFVNLSGLVKTGYPIWVLIDSADPAMRERAWIACATHATTLLTLELLGRPAVSLQASGPGKDAWGPVVAFRF